MPPEEQSVRWVHCCHSAMTVCYSSTKLHTRTVQQPCSESLDHINAVPSCLCSFRRQLAPLLCYVTGRCRAMTVGHLSLMLHTRTVQQPCGRCLDHICAISICVRGFRRQFARLLPLCYHWPVTDRQQSEVLHTRNAE